MEGGGENKDENENENNAGQLNLAQPTNINDNQTASSQTIRLNLTKAGQTTAKKASMKA